MFKEHPLQVILNQLHFVRLADFKTGLVFSINTIILRLLTKI